VPEFGEEVLGGFGIAIQCVRSSSIHGCHPCSLILLMLHIFFPKKILYEPVTIVCVGFGIRFDFAIHAEPGATAQLGCPSILLWF